MISHKTHNIVDFVFGLTLLFLPTLSGLDAIEPARNVFWGVGAFVIFYSVVTKYHYSFVKLVSLRYHMATDIICGLFLLVAPNIFSFRDSLSTGQYGLEILAGLTLVFFVGVSKLPRGGENPYSKTFIETGHFSFHHRR